jgi:hypothetical protein
LLDTSESEHIDGFDMSTVEIKSLSMS